MVSVVSPLAAGTTVVITAVAPVAEAVADRVADAAEIAALAAADRGGSWSAVVGEMNPGKGGQMLSLFV
jgi:hypothetical protein